MPSTSIEPGDTVLTEARDLLAPIYEPFTEGFGTADLQAAKRLIDALS